MSSGWQWNGYFSSSEKSTSAIFTGIRIGDRPYLIRIAFPQSSLSVFFLDFLHFKRSFCPIVLQTAAEPKFKDALFSKSRIIIGHICRLNSQFKERAISWKTEKLYISSGFVQEELQHNLISLVLRGGSTWNREMRIGEEEEEEKLIPPNLRR